MITRLEELRLQLERPEREPRNYALQALLSLLWVEEGRERLMVASALCGCPPTTGKAEAPQCAQRLCSRLGRAEEPEGLPAPPPPDAELRAWAGRALADVLSEACSALKTEEHSERAGYGVKTGQEAQVLKEGLVLARRLETTEVVEVCVRLLRLLPPEQARAATPMGRVTTGLRAAAALTLGTLSPDGLYPLWVGLGSPDIAARKALLPALDYLHDARALPYLLRLAERRFQWPDGEMVGWFLVRALERLGDRRALPALRRIAVSNGQPHTSPALALEARRVVEQFEYSRHKQERRDLLRPFNRTGDELLRPAADTPDDIDDRAELLRPDVPEEET